MRNRALIIIGFILLLCIGIGAYIFSLSPEYQNITMNGVTFEVPKSNITVSNMGSHYSIFNDSENGIFIQVFDSEGSGLNDFGQMVEYAAIRDLFQDGAQERQDSGIKYNYSENLKVYTYLTNYTHKNVFIVTKNEEDMKHIISSIKVNVTNDSSNETNNATNDTNSSGSTSNTKSEDTNKKSADSEYGDYINDKWVSMSEEEYAERYPVLYHQQSLKEGKYDKYHPDMYEVDRENGYIE